VCCGCVADLRNPTKFGPVEWIGERVSAMTTSLQPSRPVPFTPAMVPRDGWGIYGPDGKFPAVHIETGPARLVTGRARSEERTTWEGYPSKSGFSVLMICRAVSVSTLRVMEHSVNPS